jgi:hypothetical protein
MTNHEKILALNAIWYDCVSCESHKDVEYFIFYPLSNQDLVGYES